MVSVLITKMNKRTRSNFVGEGYVYSPIVLMISEVYTYLQIHEFVHIKYVQIFHVNHT